MRKSFAFDRWVPLLEMNDKLSKGELRIKLQYDVRIVLVREFIIANVRAFRKTLSCRPIYTQISRKYVEIVCYLFDVLTYDS
jgi:hypothetical protein